MNTNIIKHEGEINLVGVKLPCYVLEDGTRVLSVSETQEVLKKIGTNSISKEKRLNGPKPIPCYKGNIAISCYEATILIDIWEIYHSDTARIKGQSPKQRLVAEQQEVLFFSFAKVGITSLIDEATGYQQERKKEEIQVLTKAYIISKRATGLVSESDKNDFFKYLVLRYYSQKELGN
jgi:hypothetical protein